MKPKNIWIVFSGFVILVISACGLLDGLNPIENVASEVEDLVDQIPMDQIENKIEGIKTELPEEIGNLAAEIPATIETLATDLPGNLDAIATDLPSDIDDIIGDLGNLGDLIGDDTGSEEVPEDIPIVDAPTEDLLVTDNVVSYETSMDFASVLAFYQEEMLQNGWTEKEGSVTTADAALLYYEKPDRESTITLSYNQADGKTIVMIIIQEK